MRFSPRRPLFWFLLALVPRLLYLFEQSATSPTFYRPQLDEAEMVASADAWLRGEHPHEPLFKAPLYPFLLALVRAATGDLSLWIMRFLQHLLGAWLCVLAFQTARRLFPEEDPRATWAGPFAAALLALNGPLIRMENSLLLDFTALFLQSALLGCLVRSLTLDAQAPFNARLRSLAGAGVLAGLAWLTRPTLLPVMPLLALATLIGLRPVTTRRNRLVLASVLLLPLLVSVALFTASNGLRTGIALWQPWQGGFNLYEANREGASGRYLKQRTFVATQSPNPTHDLMIAEYRRAHPTESWDRSAPVPGDRIHAWYMARARADILADPLRWLGLMLRKAVWLGSAREIYNIEDYDIMRSLSRVLPWTRVGFGLLLPLALCSLAARGLRGAALGVIWTYTLGLGACIALFFVSGRLRLPLVFPATLLASVSLASLSSLCPRRKAAAGALTVLGGVWSWGDWWGVRSEDFRAPEFARLSNATWQDGHAGLALAYADRAAEADPDYPTLPQMRAQALFSQKKFAEAAAQFEIATKRIPNDPVSPFNLGLIYFRQLSDPARALPWFEESVRRNPGYLDAVWMRPRTLFRMGRLEEARLLLLELRRNGTPQGSPYCGESLYWEALAFGTEATREPLRKRLLASLWGESRVREIEAEWRSGQKSIESTAP